MAKVRVTFNVRPNRPCEELYLIGSTKNIGAWDTNKASKMKYNNELNAFVINKLFEENEAVEFKFISYKDWKAVEKGIWNEEICNRIFVPTKGLKLNLTIEHI
ncbi:MAG: hypothetical protein IJV94_02500 [Bacilli bacterium]|nr:hypothetical protein [Bacilli bacterium]